MIFWIQLSEFIRSVNFGSNLKKTTTKKKKFTQKWIFIYKKYILKSERDFSEPSEFEISHSVESYDEKYAENFRNCYFSMHKNQFICD